ncbi:MAG: helix-turn-helix transcriptional regulator [Cytophagales bacterium]|nr:helix-turn-helix transcriptional regulator [Armatimonadota bacterium]
MMDKLLADGKRSTNSGNKTDWRSLQWQIPLSVPPEVIKAGLGFHGRNGNERYLMTDLWSLHLYPYHAAVRFGPHSLPIHPGYVSVIPPNLPVEYEYRDPVQHLFVHFRCASVSPSPRPGEIALIPAMQDLGQEFAGSYTQMEEMVQDLGQPRYRIQAHLWATLCRLTDLPPSPHNPLLPAAPHPAVQRVLQQIEMRLAETISVAELAREAGVSYSYLGRLFGETVGTTVVAYIRERRLQRAEHLLRHSTLPIKVIAGAVGIPDLHFFNKCLRRARGKSPRAIRAEGPDPEAVTEQQSSQIPANESGR